MEPLTFLLNDKLVTCTEYDVRAPLVDTLRALGKVGTHVACGQGNCGACTVLVQFAGESSARAVNSCLCATGAILPREQNHASVTTIEAAQQPGVERDVATAIADDNGSQCGFCTAGMVMKASAAKKLLDVECASAPKLADIEDILNGNLCRCTGYRPILFGIKKALDGHSDEFKAQRKATPSCVTRDDQNLQARVSDSKDYLQTYSTGHLTAPGLVLKPVEPVTAAALAMAASMRVVPTAAAVGAPAGGAAAAHPVAYHPVAYHRNLDVSAESHQVGLDGVTPATSAPMTRPVARTALFTQSHHDAWSTTGGHLLHDEAVPMAADTTTPTAATQLTAEEAARRASMVTSTSTATGAAKQARTETTVGVAAPVQQWHDALSVEDALHVLDTFSGARVVAGNVDSAWRPLQHEPVDRHFVAIGGIEALRKATKQNNQRQIGACVTLAKLRQLLKDDGLEEAARHVGTIANRQVRALGTVGGNLAAARVKSAPHNAKASDVALLLAALGAKLDVQEVVAGKMQQREVTPTEFVSGVSLKPAWLLTAVRIALPAEPVAFDRIGWRVENHPSVISVALTRSTLFYSDAPRATVATVNVSSANSIDELVATVSQAIVRDDANFQQRRLLLHLLPRLAMRLSTFTPNHRWATLPTTTLLDERKKVVSGGQQSFFVSRKLAPITEPIIKPAAYLQAYGEVRYTVDAPVPPNCLFAAYVVAPTARFKFDEVALQKRAEEYGATHCMIARDLPAGANIIKFDRVEGFGEFIVAPGAATYAGQPIALVLSERNEADARRIAAQTQAHLESLPPRNASPPVFDVPTPNDPSATERQLNLVVTARGLGEFGRTDEEGRKAWDAQFDAWARDEHVVVAESAAPVLAGSQNHFYFEPQTAMCVPEEGARYRLFASTQSSKLLQSKCAAILGVPVRDVVVTNNRIGGGFGGKEPQSLPTAAAVAAATRVFGRPVRLSLDRITDLRAIGKRHAFVGRYRVAAERNTGKLLGIDLRFDADAGTSSSVTNSVVELAVLLSDNAYNAAHFRCEGTAWLTNKPTGTAMRSFGVIQAITIAETAVEHALWLAVGGGHAALTKRLEARATNFYRNGQKTPLREALQTDQANPFVEFGQKLLQADHLPKVWEKVTGSAEFTQRVAAVEKFNNDNKWRKRGIAALPLKYGVSFTAVFMNQGSAKLSVYGDDGTILVQHGGIEMGQGINVKVQQVVAATLNVPLGLVRVAAHSTEAVPNAMDTGASTGADINVPAAKAAAVELYTRLTAWLNQLPDDDATKQKWRANHDSWRYAAPLEGSSVSANAPAPDSLWRAVVKSAFAARQSLLATGFHTPSADGDVPLTASDVFYYYNYAAAATEIELDVLTGQIDVLRSDILYDAGLSTNPAVDIGQIEGGFVQGLGNVLTELVEYDEVTGRLKQDSVLSYAIPDHRTIPRTLNVSLHCQEGGLPLDRVDHRSEAARSAVVPWQDIQRAKTTGEPPLVLAVTTLMAARDAIAAARASLERPLENQWIELSTPLPPQAVINAIWDDASL